jgi:hypothetical protein
LLLTLQSFNKWTSSVLTRIVSKYAFQCSPKKYHLLDTREKYEYLYAILFRLKASILSTDQFLRWSSNLLKPIHSEFFFSDLKPPQDYPDFANWLNPLKPILILPLHLNRWKTSSFHWMIDSLDNQIAKSLSFPRWIRFHSNFSVHSLSPITPWTGFLWFLIFLSRNDHKLPMSALYCRILRLFCLCREARISSVAVFFLFESSAVIPMPQNLLVNFPICSLFYFDLSDFSFPTPL